MTLILTTDEAAGLLDMPQAITAIEAAFREQPAGLLVGHPPFAVNMMPDRPQETIGSLMDQRLRVVSGGLLGSRKAGLRCGPRTMSNGAAGAANVLLLYDCSGELLSVMGYPYSVLRTGATVGLAVKYMAREDSSQVALLGTGNNAVSLLEGVTAVRGIAEIAVHSRNVQRREAFCARASEVLRREVHAASTPEEAIHGADIVLLATSSHEPVIRPEWLEPGMHVSSMGPLTELHPDVMAMAEPFVVGSKEAELNNYYEPSGPLVLKSTLESGRLQLDSIVELGDLVTQRVQSRTRSEQINVFHESQGGFGDVALGAAALAQARERGVGQLLQL